MSELTLLVLRIAFLAMLWIFIFIVIYALRSDLFGIRLTRLQQHPPANPAPPAGRTDAQATRSDAATTATPTARKSQPTTGGRGISRLIVTDGPKTGLEVDIPVTGITIGRASGSGLQIKDDYTSGNHAKIYSRDGVWILEDLASTNGTFLDGRRVKEPVPVGPGNSVKIGTTTFELRR